MRTFVSTQMMTVLALCAFAGNSILCRLALTETPLGADQFSLIRLLCGAGFFALLILICRSPQTTVSMAERFAAMLTWRHALSGLCLFLYAALFSRGYVQLDAATGALVLFLTVQISMLLWGIMRGQTASVTVWLGMGLALAGFFYLLWPPGSAEWSGGLVWMGLSGLAWAVYSLLGQGSTRALEDTALNFLWTVPWCVLLYLVQFFVTPATSTPVDGSSPMWLGVMLAATSGVITSGLGYAIWYRALPGLSAIQAGMVQLAVPVLTAVAAWMLLGETQGWRLGIAMLLSLGGLSLVLLVRDQRH